MDPPFGPGGIDTARETARRENEGRAEREYADGVCVLASAPSWITLDPGTRCNLSCVQCVRQVATEEFLGHTTDHGLFEATRGALPYLQRLSLVGLGEPLLNDSFWRIVEDPATRGIPRVDISSNGTLLSDRNVERLLGSSVNFVNISIDGATQETFGRIRSGDLNKVRQGVKRLTARRRALGRDDFTVWATMTLMMENIRELPLVVDLAHELGMDAIWAQHLAMSSDDSFSDWRVDRNGWTFVYHEQHLSNAPALANAMIRQALSRAGEVGIHFELDPALWLKE